MHLINADLAASIFFVNYISTFYVLCKIIYWAKRMGNKEDIPVFH
ncbi:hypothetical protein B4168_0953 [Anoxybacillus flavithermus]|nr:hypothetical protein B4168_0953 [Anoxybacillus flavithermus]OAO86960.1 hypothetical protein GT23_1978 [Parageobacillus thermoglucosidasius]